MWQCKSLNFGTSLLDRFTEPLYIWGGIVNHRLSCVVRTVALWCQFDTRVTFMTRGRSLVVTCIVAEVGATHL